MKLQNYIIFFQILVTNVGAHVPRVISSRACTEVMATIFTTLNMENVANLLIIHTSGAFATMKISKVPLTRRDGARVTLVII